VNAETAPPAGLERRRAERVRVPPRGGAVSVVGARLVNISGYGMMIESLVPLEAEARMDFRLVIAGEKVDVEARVAACSLLSSGRRRVFGVGCEFTSLSDSVRERLVAAIQTGIPPRAGGAGQRNEN
jgi:PilZ domain